MEIVRNDLAISDTVVELCMYIHHLIFQQDRKTGDWFWFNFALARELARKRIKTTGSSRIWPPNPLVPRHSPAWEQFIKTHKEGMPVHNQLLRALEIVGIDIETWKNDLV
jgi:hypothetical protein